MKAAQVTLSQSEILIAAAEPFPDDRDRFECALAAAVGIGLAAGLDSGTMIRSLQSIMDVALEVNAEVLASGLPRYFGDRKP